MLPPSQPDEPRRSALRRSRKGTDAEFALADGSILWVEIITYALMGNHFHLLVRVPAKAAADAWEQTNFSELKAASWQDADGDGWTNLEEYLNKTNPKFGDDPMNSTALPHVEGPLVP